MKNITGFYTLYLINNWYDILRKQLYLLAKSELYERISNLNIHCIDEHLNLKERKKLKHLIKSYDINNKIKITYHETNNAEYYTLLDLYNYSFIAKDSYLIYFHSKGVYSQFQEHNNSYCIESWRDRLNYFIIEEWKYNYKIMEENNYDVLGPDYMTHGIFNKPIFDGNFWWANSNYISSRLKRPGPEFLKDRREAELWICSGAHKWTSVHPKIMDYYFNFIRPEEYRKDLNK